MKKLDPGSGLLKKIKRLYVEHEKSIPQISDVVGMKKSSVRLYLIRLGVKLRSRTDAIRLRSDILGKHNIGRKVKFSKSWKNNIRLGAIRRWRGASKGVSLKPNGYFEITTGPNKGRSLHSVVLENKIGRRLKVGEVAHHKDENKQNNHPDNLEVMTRSEHTKHHRKKQHGKF
jgi:hypothetical protein